VDVGARALLARRDGLSIENSALNGSILVVHDVLGVSASYTQTVEPHKPISTSTTPVHKGQHAVAIDLKAVPGIGAEIVLTVDGEWRKTRLFRSHEQAELVGAIADTRATFEGKG
jgi:hypothetical protein